MKHVLLIGAAALVLLQSPVATQNPGQDAKNIIDAAVAAMGTGGLQSVQYTGTGSNNSTGQAYQSGGPWPRFTVKKYTMSIDYTAPSMRQDIVRIDDAKPPRGGGAGGYNPMTFQGGIRPVPGDIIQNQNTDGRTQAGALNFWLTPHGFLRGAAANVATAKAALVRGKQVVSFTAFGKYTVAGTLSPQHRVEHVETMVDVAYTGDTALDATYSDYRDFGGVKFPMHVVMREGGFPTLDIAVADVRLNGAGAVGVPVTAGGGGNVERQPEKIADGVWFLTPGIEGSVLVEFKDYVIVVEAPSGEAYTTAALARIKAMMPNKPIRYVVNTHHHADHAAGLRAYVAEGVPIITHESHRKYYEDQIFKNPHSLNPDRLARAPRASMIETMRNKRVLTDGSMTLELHLMRDQPHSEGMVMAYVPTAKLLIQSDAYVPRPGAPPLPAPSPYTINLVENVARLKLDVERVAHVHGGLSPYTDVLAAAGRAGTK